jgi:hypothetical protein
MPKSELTASGLAIFVVLLTKSEPLTTDELGRTLGLTNFKSTPLKPLVDRGFVEVGKVKVRRNYVNTYQVSADGWERCAEVLGAEVSGTGSAAKALIALVKSLKNGLAASAIKPREFFHPTKRGAESPSADTEAMIRKAYADLAKVDGDWVSLADIRDRLGSLDHNTVGLALVALARADQSVKLIRWDDQKVLTDRERAASVRYGAADAHALRIESP